MPRVKSVLKMTAGFPVPSPPEVEAMARWVRAARPRLGAIASFYAQWPDLGGAG